MAPLDEKQSKWFVFILGRKKNKHSKLHQGRIEVLTTAVINPKNCNVQKNLQQQPVSSVLKKKSQENKAPSPNSRGTLKSTKVQSSGTILTPTPHQGLSLRPHFVFYPNVPSASCALNHTLKVCSL